MVIKLARISKQIKKKKKKDWKEGEHTYHNLSEGHGLKEHNRRI